MSALVMGLVWEMPETQEFGRAEKYILLAYADHADSNGKNIYPSVDLVSRKTFYEERSVQATTRRLQGLGLLIPDGQGPHGTNRFHIPIQHFPDGGAKIAPVQNAVQKIAPEGIAPEGIAPEPSLVVLKPSSATADAQRGEIFTFYQNEIGMISPMIAESLNMWIDDKDFPRQWIVDAIRRAAVMNKRSWAYIETILKAWKAAGKQDTRPSKKEYGNGNTGKYSSGTTKAKAGTGARRKSDNRAGGYSDADRAAADFINGTVGVQ